MHKPFVFTAIAVFLLTTTAFSQGGSPASATPTTPTGGSGIAWFPTRYSDSNYATYKNGVMEGPYSCGVEVGERVEGEVTYKKSAVNYIPAKRVTWSVGNKPPVTALFELNSFKSIFSADDTNRKVLSAIDDSVAEQAPTYPFISVSFGDDPAVIPRGAWRVISTKTGKDVALVDYDDNGNAIRIRYFDEEGTVIREEHFAPCGKRKMRRRDPNGMGSEQICPLEIPN
jgi:hypothetical protein